MRRGVTTFAGAWVLLAAEVAQARRARQGANTALGFAVDDSIDFDSATATQELRALQDLRSSGVGIAEEAWSQVRHDLDRGSFGHLLFQVGDAISSRTRARGDEDVHAALAATGGASGVAGLGGAEEHLLQTAGLVFFALVSMYFIKVFVYDWPLVAQNAKKREDIAHQASYFYLKQVKTMLQQLQVAQESSSLIAERHFQEKFRGFAKFLNQIVRDQMARDKAVVQAGGVWFGGGSQSVLLDPLRDLLVMWMKAFEQCSIDPDTNPTILCPEHKVRSGKTLADAASVLLEESRGKVTELAGDDMKEAQKFLEEMHKDSKAKKTLSPSNHMGLVCHLGISWRPCSLQQNDTYPYDIFLFCIRLQIVSGWHARVVMLGVVVLGLAIALHVTAQHVVGGCMDAAVVMVYILSTMADALDDARRLELELKSLKTKESKLQEVRSKIDLLVQKYDRVAKLWQFQTMNRLDLFDAISILYSGFLRGDSKDSGTGSTTSLNSKVASLRDSVASLNSKVRYAMEGFGALSLYLQKDSEIEDEVLAAAAKQIANNITRVADCADRGEQDKVEELLEHLCGFLVLHIKSAQQLPNKDGGVIFDGSSLTDAYVLVRIAEVHRRDCPATDVITDSLDPEWDEQFFIPMQADQGKLTLEVYHSNEDKWLGTPRQAIGYVKLDFRSSGYAKWISRKDHLHFFASHKKMKAMLVYSFMYMVSIKQLAKLDGEGSDAGSTYRGGRRLTAVDGSRALQSIGTFLHSGSASQGLTGVF